MGLRQATLDATMSARVHFFGLVSCLAAGCGTPSAAAAPRELMDIHSHCQPAHVRVTHVSLDLAIDFTHKEVSGSVRLDLDRQDPAAPLVLDAQGLVVESVRGADGTPRAFELGPPDPNLGSALTITLAPADRALTVAYHTTEHSDALQWLAPEQTSGKKAPFLFTQGESIFTRTWIPLQDSPGVRITYDAKVRVTDGGEGGSPPSAGARPSSSTGARSNTSTGATDNLTVVMSAEQLGRGPDGAFRFRMQHPIPSYLIAMACGDLAFEPISKRCGIWAEPSVVHAARKEFEDTEAMIESAEALFGPYRWGRYDVIVLPPAFPFGGMENPCLTFATPTVLTGDKSLVALVAHELAHSWSGNLVTNATWSDFWLNEGFTVYFEIRIMEKVYGRERAVMEAQLDLADLAREMKDLEARDQVLHIDLVGRHPDDGFTGVPYNKGASLLWRIEEVFGREKFDRFLRSYFDDHAFQSITTEGFVEYLKRNLFAQDPKKAAEIDLDEWLTKPGMPKDAPQFDSPALVRVDREIELWKAKKDPKALDMGGFVTQQWLHFLEGIADSLDAASMKKLDDAFHFTSSPNCEIADVWLRLSIQCDYKPADARLEEFLMTIGRRKFLEPLYKEMAKTEAGKAKARAIYAKARPRYHAVSTATIDKILGWKA
jgi:aminopeptidase N